MTADERVQFLLRAASRAEMEGDPRVALILRRRAAEARPAEPGESAPEEPFQSPALAE